MTNEAMAGRPFSSRTRSFTVCAACALNSTRMSLRKILNYNQKGIPMRKLLTITSVCCVLSLVFLARTSYAGTNLVTTTSQGSGAAWTAAIWKTNNGAGVGVGTAVAPVAGNTYTCVTNGVAYGNSTANTRVRNPVVTGVQTFPGDSLTLLTNTDIRCKTATGLIINFPGVGGNPGLILNGGVLNAGDNAIFVITGSVQVVSQSY